MGLLSNLSVFSWADILKRYSVAWEITRCSLETILGHIQSYVMCGVNISQLGKLEKEIER